MTLRNSFTVIKYKTVCLDYVHEEFLAEVAPLLETALHGDKKHLFSYQRCTVTVSVTLLPLRKLLSQNMINCTITAIITINSASKNDELSK